MSKYRAVRETLNNVVCEIDHGECLYSEKGLEELFEKIDSFKNACKEYYEEVQSEELE